MTAVTAVTDPAGAGELVCPECSAGPFGTLAFLRAHEASHRWTECEFCGARFRPHGLGPHRAHCAARGARLAAVVDDLPATYAATVAAWVDEFGAAELAEALAIRPLVLLVGPDFGPYLTRLEAAGQLACQAAGAVVIVPARALELVAAAVTP